MSKAGNIGDLFNKYKYSAGIKLDNFEKYVRRQSIARFIARYELFKTIIEVKGSIVECGVHYGGGLMGWAKLSASLEPMAIHRKVIGFDTFEGFPCFSKHDEKVNGNRNESLHEGGFSPEADTYSELIDAIEDYDSNRFLNQFQKIELVKGDAVHTIPEYVRANPHLIVALLFLDFDLYEPTLTAIKHFLPRIPKGGCIAFDELNNANWPGETVALLESLGDINRLAIRRFSFDPNISYVIL